MDEAGRPGRLGVVGLVSSLKGRSDRVEGRKDSVLQ